MNIEAPFGFVTGCHAGDRHLVVATLASIRQYCPKVPICLTVDGDCDVSDLVRDYGVIVLRISELSNKKLSKQIEKSFHAKQAAMWEGPFEFYVWLDSDAILWGDITPQINSELDFQIFWEGISIPKDAKEVPQWLLHYYFDPALLVKYDPTFEWRGNVYFSAGVYAARRGVFEIEKYLKLKSESEKQPKMFAFDDMGILNYLVHSYTQNGKIKSGYSDLQHIPEHHGRKEFETDCLGHGWRFPEKIKRPRVAHFCGKKPFLYDFRSYSKPYTIARLQHHRLSHNILVAWLIIIIEDAKTLRNKVFKKITKYKSSRIFRKTPATFEVF